MPHRSAQSGQKILSREGLAAARAQARARGQRVVHCHGCFDIVHPGHIRHLRFAKAQGDFLLVSITGDAGVGKGEGRPLIPQELRAENLAELDCVDWVYVSPDPTAVELLGEVQPDVYIKGREYEHNHDPRFEAERHAVESAGGRVVFSSGDVVFSSTALIDAVESSIDPFHARLRTLLEEPELTAPRLAGSIEAMRGQRVVIVGEVILDTYVFCDRPDVAGESPVLTLRPLEHRHFDGGAAILARHAAAMGARPVLVTALPSNERGDEMRRRLVADGVEVRAVEVSMRIPEKQRFLVQTQKVMKVDLVDPIVLDAQQRDELIATAEGAAREAPTDAAIVADFGLGVLTPAVLERLIPKLRSAARVVSGDVSGRRSSLREMRGLDLVCPSESELRDAYGNYGDGLPAVTWRLLEQTGTKAAIVTMGAEGQIGFGRLPGASQGEGWATRLRGEHVPSLIAHAVDPLGCGDSLLAASTLALAGGASLLASSMIGAAAAAVQARRLGNSPISAADLRKEIQRIHGARLTFAPEQTQGIPVELKGAGEPRVGATA
ncbi:MAG: rfaE bifunctional protein kinase chain/domain [Phycisphaerales bacterium]|jgi:rfaE bifunctional protein kinase chain/domain/rfaE bifunctional protein nucleotidyltransferase chain/domain